MELTSTITYDRALIRRALNCFMVKRMRWTGISGFLAAGILLCGERLYGSWGLVVSIFAAVYTFLFALIVCIYLLRLRISYDFIRKSKTPAVKIVFDDEGISTESELGSSKINWQAFDDLLKFPDLWLLTYRKSGYVTIPLDQISPECQMFIEQKLKDSAANN